MVEQGRFRKDLYYRLSVVNLRIPPLRERKQDIPLLAAHFLERMSRETGTAHTLSDDALRTLVEYEWPGNVRELEHSIDRACTLSSGPVCISAICLPSCRISICRIAGRSPSRRRSVPPVRAAAPVMPLAQLEKEAILDTLRKLNGDKLLAARLLGIGKTTLYRKLKEYGISPPDGEDHAG